MPKRWALTCLCANRRNEWIASCIPTNIYALLDKADDGSDGARRKGEERHDVCGCRIEDLCGGRKPEWSGRSGPMRATAPRYGARGVVAWWGRVGVPGSGNNKRRGSCKTSSITSLRLE